MKRWLLEERDHHLFLDKEYYGDLNDKIDKILHIPSNDFFHSYFLYHDNTTLALRIPGSTIGHMNINNDTIENIIIYDYFLKKYDQETKNKIISDLNQFVGDKYYININ